MRVYSNVSGRRSQSEITRLHKEGLLSEPVRYNTVNEYMNQPWFPGLLKHLLLESAAPLASLESQLAIDGTGFTTNSYTRYYDTKYGREMSRAKAIKAHAACGVLTNVCTALEVDQRADTKLFIPLLVDSTKRFNPDQVSADKGYIEKANFEAAAKMGVEPFIHFKDGNRADPKAPMWDKMLRYFKYKREEWEEHYHARSNVETMFSMVKGKFGGHVRSKNLNAQQSEIYLKFICHNIVVLIHAMYESNLAPEFWKNRRAS